MTRLVPVFCVLLVHTASAAAQPLICFGNEPSWSIELRQPDGALVSAPGAAAPVLYRGREIRHEPTKEGVWRGKASDGGELVLFKSDVACSDGMSDKKHPVTARASLPGAFLIGCCRTPSADGGPGIENTTWRLVRLPGHEPAALTRLKRGVTLRFEEGRLSGFAGCNNLTGTYALNRSRVTLGPVASTMMACADPIMAVERAFKAALTGTLSYEVAGERLTLTTAAGATLAFERDSPGRLEGATWTVTGFNNGRQAVVSPIAGTSLTMSFNKGTVAGHSGCNRFRAPYTTEGDRITIRTMVLTRMECKGTMAQEREFLDALQSSRRWSVAGDQLDMYRADEERTLTATTLRGR